MIGFNALTDLVLIIISLAVILGLKMHRSDKLVLASILSLSLLYAPLAPITRGYLTKQSNDRGGPENSTDSSFEFCRVQPYVLLSYPR